MGGSIAAALTLVAAWPSRASAPVPETVAFCEEAWPLATTSLMCLGGRGSEPPMDLGPLRRLPHLTSLRLISGELEFIFNLPLRDLAPLSSLKELKVLWVEHATFDATTPEVGRLSALAALTGLEHLVLHAVSLRDVSPLAKLVRLEELDLSCTAVSDVTSLAALGGLKRLDLTRTLVRDVRPLAALTHLEWLGLSTGAVDAAQLEALQRALPALRISEGRLY